MEDKTYIKKECKLCRETKDINMFVKDKYRKDGYKTICKECNNIHSKSYKIICVCCKKEFLGQKKSQQYCSVECRSLARRKRVKTFCYTCGKNIEKIPREFARAKHHYCSNACKDKAIPKLYTGVNNSNYNRIKCFCDYCGKEINITHYKFNRDEHHYCGVDCKNKHRPIVYSGERHHAYSKIDVKCDECGKVFKRSKSLVESKKRNLCSYVCASISFSKHYSGENNSLYNKDLSDEHRGKYRLLYNYNSFSKKVFERDRYTCQCCGDSKGGNLNAHHLDGYNWCIDKRTDINNGVTLCQICHKDFHSKYGYGNNTKEQFYEFLSKIYFSKVESPDN